MLFGFFAIGKSDRNKVQFLVAPAAEQSDLSSLYGVWLVGCLLVDRELNFKY